MPDSTILLSYLPPLTASLLVILLFLNWLFPSFFRKIPVTKRVAIAALLLLAWVCEVSYSHAGNPKELTEDFYKLANERAQSDEKLIDQLQKNIEKLTAITAEQDQQITKLIAEVDDLKRRLDDGHLTSLEFNDVESRMKEAATKLEDFSSPSPYANIVHQVPSQPSLTGQSTAGDAADGLYFDRIDPALQAQLHTLHLQGATINSVSFVDPTTWVVIFNNIDYQANGISQKLKDDLDNCKASHMTMRGVHLGPHDTFLLDEAGVLKGSGLPCDCLIASDGVADQLRNQYVSGLSTCTQGSDLLIDDVVITDSGGFMVSGGDHLCNCDAPQGLIDAITDCHQKNQNISHVVASPDFQSFALILGNKSYVQCNLPTRLLHGIEAASKSGGTIDTIALGRNQSWLMLGPKNLACDSL